MAYTHYRDHTGEHRPWVITSAAFFGVAVVSAASLLWANPGVFAPQVKPATVGTLKTEADPEPPAPEPGQKQPPQEIKTPVLSQWRPVTKFSGSDSGSTGVFHIKGEQWRIRWELERKAPQSQFSFYVYKKGSKTPLPPSSLISGIDKEKRLFEPGDFYIQVKGSKADWSFTIDDHYSDEPATTTTQAP